MINTTFRKIIIVTLTTMLILSIPFIGMQFSTEVNWTLSDFVVAGLLFLGAGYSYVFISQKSQSKKHRLAFGISVIASLLIIWTILAVGIIGDGSNPANLMYLGVIVVGIFSSIVVRFRTARMAYALFITAGAHFLVMVTTLLINFELSSSENLKIFLFNSVFIGLWVLSGMLFKKSTSELESA